MITERILRKNKIEIIVIESKKGIHQVVMRSGKYVLTLEQISEGSKEFKVIEQVNGAGTDSAIELLSEIALMHVRDFEKRNVESESYSYEL